MPLPFDDSPAPQVKAGQVPRLSHWFCREDEVFWTRGDHGGCLYKKGDVVTVDFADYEQPHRFDYGRGFWYPEGAKIVDLNTMRCMPWQFEPFHPDGKRETVELWKRLLVNPLMLNYARAKVEVPDPKAKKPFLFKFESEDRVQDIGKLGLPEPIDPKNLNKDEEPIEKFNPSDLAARGGVH